MINNSTNNQTIAMNVALSGSGGGFNAAAGSIVVNGTVSGTGALTKTGTGTLVLNGSESYGGQTLVSAGTLQFGTATTPYGIGFYGASGTIGGGGTPAGNGSIIIGNAATLLFDTDDAFGKATFGGGNTTVQVNAGGMVTNGLYSEYGIKGAFAAMHNFHLSGGTLRSTGGGSTPAAWGAYCLSGTVTADGVVESTISQATASDPDYINSRGFINLFSGATTFNILHNTSGVDLLVSAQLADYNGGTSALVKNGPGLMVLAATNTYTGGTTINGGILMFANSGALPASGSVSTNAGGALAATGAYSTVTGWLQSSKIATSSNGAIALTANSSETVNMAGYNWLSLGTSGSISYSGTLTSAAGQPYLLGGGGGTLTLNNTFADATGAVAITAPGTVQLGTASLANRSISLANGTLALGSQKLTLADGVTLSGAGRGQRKRGRHARFDHQRVRKPLTGRSRELRGLLHRGTA